MKRNPLRAALGQLRRSLVAARDHLDGWLHGRRRRRAAATLARLAPTSILFLCLGNVCRSPYAARVMATRVRYGLRVDSAGFIGPGRPPPDEAIRVAGLNGIQHADHVSKLVTRELLESSDVAFVFDRFNARRVRESAGARLDRILWLGDFDPQWTGKRAIADPWGKSVEEFQATFARIDRCVDAVLRNLDAP